MKTYAFYLLCCLFDRPSGWLPLIALDASGNIDKILQKIFNEGHNIRYTYTVTMTYIKFLMIYVRVCVPATRHDLTHMRPMFSTHNDVKWEIVSPFNACDVAQCNE